MRRLGASAAVLGLVAVVLDGGCAKRVAVPIPEGEDYVFAAGAAGDVSVDEAEGPS